MTVEWEFVRAMECAMAVATVRLFGERGNAARRVMARIMAELLEEDLPDDPREALIELLEPFAEVELEGDELRVKGCRLCYSSLIRDVADPEELETIRQVPPCPFILLFDELAKRKGWDVRPRPEATPLSGETEPGSCVQWLVSD
ncbi:hypothetical protein [Methanopyrus kandleri]|uniref:hypothetical protein n=1 Tax=Methanopyrus kandleri TaxID=2320 RepID=UPI0011E521D0|nr:hypothetical protein [Methanopyrus kandleri]